MAMDLRSVCRSVAIASSLWAAGCATSVPEMHRLGQTAPRELAREGDLVVHIKCELVRSLRLIREEEARNPHSGGYGTAWLDHWGAKVNLKLQVDETAALAPSLTLTTPMENVISIFSKGGAVTSAQSRSVALGASLSSHATRTETIGFYYRFADLLADARYQDPAARCEPNGARLIDGDLKIYDFMRSKVQISRVPGVIPRDAKTPPFDVFNYEVSFVVTGSGSVTPAWKLAAISLDPASPFLNASRTRTDDMVLTMGEVADNGRPTKAASDAHLAALIGQALQTAIQSQQP